MRPLASWSVWALFLGALGCSGGASGAGGTGGSATTSSECVPPVTASPPTCASWSIAGPLVEVDAAPSTAGGPEVGAVLPSGDGALVAWLDIGGASTWSAHTRSIHFDGTARGADHALPLYFPEKDGMYATSVSLARRGCDFGALVVDEEDGCRFLPLDADGAVTGAVTTVEPSGVSCVELAPLGDGFSFVDLGTLSTLVSLGVDGGRLGTPTSLPPSSVDDRIVLRDGSFVLESSTDMPGNVVLQHFSAAGAPLSAAQTWAMNSGTLPRLAETPSGLIALSADPASDVGLAATPFAVDGAPSGPPVVLTDGAGDESPIFTYALAGAPNGDVLAAWIHLPQSVAAFDLVVQAVGPDGTARGPATTMSLSDAIGSVFPLVAPDGKSAFVIFGDATTATVRALPLTCVP